MLTKFTNSLFATINVTQSGMSAPISFNIGGTFGGTFFSDDMQSLKFAGNWAQTEGDQSFGGDMKMEMEVPIETDGSITQMPFNFQGAQSVSVMGYDITIPIDFSGSIPFQEN